MTETLLQWFRSSRARALALGAALVLVLALAGCSEEDNTGGDGGSESGNATQETTQQATTEETTTPPTTVSEEQEEPEEQGESGEERAQQGSSGGAASSPSEPEQRSEQPSVQQEPSGLASRGEVVTVTRVVDGDTIEVSPAVDGIQDLRLIGVDTPETYGGEEPLGPQASAFTTEALEGQEVALEFDEERVDQYDRALAYVWVSGGGMFNAQLLREGLAQVATFPPNTEYVNRFENIQAEARTAGLGIWGLSQSQQCELADRSNGIGEGSPGCTSAPEPEQQQEAAPEPAPQPSSGGGGSAPPVSEDDCPGSHPIKGNEDSGIYHPPSGGSYGVTNPEVCFASPGAAETAGYRAAQN